MNRKVAGLVVVLLVGCGTADEAEELTPEARAEAMRVARADSVAQAMDLFDATVFDTLTWENDNARWERGGVVWSFTCTRCHGADGAGKGPDAENFDIAVPDMTTADWQFADDVPGIREKIFVGHESEMPSMGLIGLSYKDVDAAAHYINDLLRSTN